MPVNPAEQRTLDPSGRGFDPTRPTFTSTNCCSFRTCAENRDVLVARPTKAGHGSACE